MLPKHSPRDLYQVMRVIERRYGSVAERLLDAFIDSESIRTLEALIAQSDDDAEAAKLAAPVEGIDLDAAAFGASAYFIQECREHGLDHSPLWEQFSHAMSYWGTNIEGWEEIQRAQECAASYEADGLAYRASIR